MGRVLQESQFVEGDIVTVAPDVYPTLDGLEGVLVREPEDSNIPWRLVLTRASQATLHKVPVEHIVPGSDLERDRLSGWLVFDNEIRKVEG